MSKEKTCQRFAFSFVSVFIFGGILIANKTALSDPNTICPPSYQEHINKRDQNTRVWEITKETKLPDPVTGRLRTEEIVSTIIEKGSGICYEDSEGNWQLSNACWQKTENGFVMSEANYQLQIGNTIDSILIYSIQDKTIGLQAAGLYAVNKNGETTQICQIAPTSKGNIDPENPRSLVFVDALGSGINIEFTVTNNGFHQNVVFNNKPVLPNDFEVNDTFLCVKTELVFNSDESVDKIDEDQISIEVVKNDNLCEINEFNLSSMMETELTENEIRIIYDRDNKNSILRFTKSNIFAKESGQNQDDDTFSLQNEIGVAKKKISKDLKTNRVYLEEYLQAEIIYKTDGAVIWDYQTKTGSVGDEIWYRNYTYYVSSHLDVSGTIKIEPGTVIKINDGVYIDAYNNGGAIIAEGNPYEHIVFTSKNDNTVGETIQDSTGTPAMQDWSYIVASDTSTFKFCRLKYADLGLAYGCNGSGGVVEHNIITDSSYGIYVYCFNDEADLKVFNNLVFACDVGIYSYVLNGNLTISNNTIDNCSSGGLLSYLCSSDDSIVIKDNLFTNCSTGIQCSSSTPPTEHHNAFYNCATNTSGFTQHATDIDLSITPYNTNDQYLGQYYLNEEVDGGELLVDGGSCDLSEADYEIPDNWSVYHVPMDNINGFDSPTNIEEDTSWQPNYSTCDTGQVAIGYHYPRVDYFYDYDPSQVDRFLTVYNSDAPVTLTVNPGTVIACGGNMFHGPYYQRTIAGLNIMSGGRLESIGTISDPVKWVYYKSISTSNEVPSGAPFPFCVEGDNGYGSIIENNEFIRFRFGPRIKSSCAFDNCKFFNLSYFWTKFSSSAQKNTVYFLNCLFTSKSPSPIEGFSHPNTSNMIYYRNCTFENCSLWFEDAYYDFNFVCVDIKNCIFKNWYQEIYYKAAIEYYEDVSLSESHNAFYATYDPMRLICLTTRHPDYPDPRSHHFNTMPIDSTDWSFPQFDEGQLLGSDPLCSEWDQFEDRYHLTENIPLIDSGFCPWQVGLPGCTTRLDGEVDSDVIDIGYHYPLDIDSDEDGLKDYREYWFGFDPQHLDTNDDELTDYDEYTSFLDPLFLDSDGDFIPNIEERMLGTDPQINDSQFPYLTSFEENQGFYDEDDEEDMTVIDDLEGWSVSEGGAADVTEAYYYTTGVEEPISTPYQYLSIGGDSTVTRQLDSPVNPNRYIHNSQCVRISCIPSAGSYINVLNDNSDKVASIYFEADDHHIYIWNNGSYQDTGLEYDSIAEQCRTFLNNTDPELDNYLYKNTWIEFEIYFDWMSQNYDVSWRHWGCTDGEIIASAQFNEYYQDYSKIKFVAGLGNSFELNRFSVSDAVDGGGVFGRGVDVWINLLEADMAHPLRGRYPITGTVWYEMLGEYKIKCCPIDLNVDDPNSWLIIDSGTCTKENAVLGYWDTAGFYNGDYYMMIEVYDDIGRLHESACGMVTKDCTFNGRTVEVGVEYPIIGKAKGKTYHYEEEPDISANWPGSFPFEFRRIYDDNLRNRLYPLYFGWTHNHNIRIIESTAYEYKKDEDGNPIGDSNLIGIGKLWFQQALGCRMFVGQPPSPGAPDQVIYLPMDNEQDYIVRTTEQTTDPLVFDANYVHHAPDGMEMTFEQELTLEYSLPDDEGAVEWILTKGIDSMEDRFGNALNYTWEDTSELYITEIASNCNDVKLELNYDLLAFEDSGPMVCGELMLTDGGESYDIIDFSTQITSYSEDDDSVCMEYGYNKYNISSTRPGQMFYTIGGVKGVVLYGHTIPAGISETSGMSSICRRIDHDIDGTLKAIDAGRWFGNLADGMVYKIFDYQYDSSGCLNTNIEYEVAGTDQQEPYVLVSIKNMQIQTSPEGAVLKQNTTTHNAEYYTGGEWKSLDPYEYVDSGASMDHYTGTYLSYSGGGAIKDLEYFYEDDRFPLKPTTIIEYFDNDQDGEYDGPERKTTYEYDERGNRIEQRVYVNDEDFVLTQYEYHTFYNFMTCQTTWKGYCNQQGDDPITTSGAKVQKQWDYGNVDGSIIDNESKAGKYLVQEKTLLDDNDPVNPDDDEWAITYYQYNSNGQVNTKKVPYDVDHYNISYYEYDDEYDDRGFLIGEYNGTEIDGIPSTAAPQKRYYYNELGLKELEADYLGKVSMYVYDDGDSGRAKELRVYYDLDVMGIDYPVFIPGRYYNQGTGEDIGDYQRKTEYHGYSYYDQCLETVLPTGGSVRKVYQAGAKSERWRKYEDNGVVDSNIHIFYDHTLRQLRSWVEIEGGAVYKNLVYDSMDRPAHIYEYNYSSSDNLPDKPYIKHSEYGYYGSGKKSYEKIYRVDRPGNDDFSNATPVLEKHTTYNYDILDRLTMKVDDPDPDGLAITVQYGYDALGTRLYVLDPEGNVIFTDYDNANRKTCEYFAAVPVYNPETGDISFELTNPAPKKEFQYYKNNKIKVETSYDYDGATLSCTEYAYDSKGRVLEVKQAIADSNQNQQIEEDEKAITTYEYHDVGIPGPLENDPNLYHIIITDAEEVAGEENHTWISLNPDGKTRKIVYPSGDYTLTGYYGHGLPHIKFVWNDGIRYAIEYEYNGFGKLEKVTYPDDGYLEYEYTKATYGKLGKVKTITDCRNGGDRPGGYGSTYEFEYNLWSGNLLRHIDHDDYTINYDYNTAYNQVTSINVKKPVEPEVIYAVNYSYDLAGRLGSVEELVGEELWDDVAGFTYDDNGNRQSLGYYHNSAEITGITYAYDLDNNLVKYQTSGGITSFNFGGTEPDYLANVDGLGRLVSGYETITETDSTPVTHVLIYSYDMLSQLTGASMTNINGSTWTADYTYDKDGNLDARDINGTVNDFGYDGDLLTAVDADTLDWDLNGNLTDGITTDMEWNWDNRLRSATVGSDNISCRYAPDGSMVYKKTTVNNEDTERKFIVDIVGKYPVILMELDPASDNEIKKTYIHANGQMLMQHDSDSSADKFFYMHDRLGSVRHLIAPDGIVFWYGATDNHYTYDPFGNLLESGTTGDTTSRFRFAGYKWDDTTGMYNCNARWYAPAIYRFTGRDPVKGKFREPLTLHAYLYCQNTPVNRVDHSGESAASITGAVIAGTAVYSASISTVCYGISHDDKWINVGLQMQNFIAPAMYFGASIGPLARPALGLMGKGTVAAWYAATEAGYTTVGVGYVMAQELSLFAMMHPYAFVSGLDILAVACDSPTPPLTPPGFLFSLYKHFSESPGD